MGESYVERRPRSIGWLDSHERAGGGGLGRGAVLRGGRGVRQGEGGVSTHASEHGGGRGEGVGWG